MNSHISRIVSNVKSPNGTNWTLNIPNGANAVLYGPNRAMKTATLNAITLGLGGFADDVAGRDGVKDGGLLASLMPEGVDELVSTLTGEGGVMLGNYRLERKAGKISTATGADAQLLTVPQVRAALASGEKTARAAFLSWMSAGVTDADITGLLPEKVRIRYTRSIASMKGSAIEKLAAARDNADARAREAAKEAKTAKTTADDLTGGEEPPLESVLAAWEEKLFTLEALHTACVVRDTQVKAREEEAERQARMAKTTAVQAPTGPDLEALGKALKEANDAVSMWEGEIMRLRDSLPQPIPGEPPITTVEAMVQWVTFGVQVGQCPCCGSMVGKSHMQSALEFFTQKQEKAGSALRDLDAARAALVQWTREAMARDATLRAEVRLREQQAAQAIGAIARAAIPRPVPQPPSNEPVDDTAMVAAELTAQRDQLAKGRQAMALAAKVAQVKAKATALLQEADDMKKLRSALDDVRGDLLRKLKMSFEEGVSRFLPDRWSFTLELESDGREVCRAGLVEAVGDVTYTYTAPRCAPSGAQWEALIMAIAMAVSNGGVCIPDDRGWDADTLAQVMDSLASGPCQVFIPSTTMPDRIPDGWVVLNLRELFGAAPEMDAMDDAVEVAAAPPQEAQPLQQLFIVQPEPEPLPAPTWMEPVGKAAIKLQTMLDAARSGDSEALAMMTGNALKSSLRGFQDKWGTDALDELALRIVGEDASSNPAWDGRAGVDGPTWLASAMVRAVQS